MILAHNLQEWPTNKEFHFIVRVIQVKVLQLNAIF